MSAYAATIGRQCFALPSPPYRSNLRVAATCLSANRRANSSHSPAMFSYAAVAGRRGRRYPLRRHHVMITGAAPLIMPPPHPCRLGGHYAATVAATMGVVTLLLVVFTNNNAEKSGHWLYSLFVVICGVAFVVFGPLLLCRVLLNAYYRQIDPRMFRLQTDAESQTPTSLTVPHRVYACIIISPEEDQPIDEPSIRTVDLPSYEQATSIENPVKTDDVVKFENCCSQNSASNEPTCSSFVENEIEEAPPTYNQALEFLENQNVNMVASMDQEVQGRDDCEKIEENYDKNAAGPVHNV